MCVCFQVDYRYDFNYLCPIEGWIHTLEALQCFDMFQELLMCGVPYVNYEHDYSGVHVKWGKAGLLYPRPLTNEEECNNPFDCLRKCQTLRDNGVAPEACTWCNTPCPVNALATMDEFMVAFGHDIFEAAKIAVTCIATGYVGCICAGALMLKPEWLDPGDLRYSPEQKCYRGDPLGLLMGEITKKLFNGGGIFSGLEKLFNGGQPVQGTERAYNGHADALAKQECEEPNRFGHQSADKCYYERVKLICNSNKLWKKYLALSGVNENLQQVPASDLPGGEPPGAAMINAFQSIGFAETHTLHTFIEPTHICRDEANINLAQVVEGCVFSMITGNPLTNEGGICNNLYADAVFDVIKTVHFELPAFPVGIVHYSWDVNPPPPPPLDAVALSLVHEYDKEYYNDLKARMDTSDWYDSVEDVLTNTIGGGGVPQDIWNMQRSRVTLALEGLDPSSIAAKMTASLFTMRWPKGCRMLHAEMDDVRNARAGGGESPYDRNVLLIWAAIYWTSYGGAPDMNFDPLMIHDMFCGAPCAWREVTPAEPQDWGNVGDSTQRMRGFKPTPLPIRGAVDCTDWSPIVNYGSLRQLRDKGGYGTGSAAMSPKRHPEDMTLYPGAISPQSLTTRVMGNALPWDYAQLFACAPLGEAVSNKNIKRGATARSQAASNCAAMFKPPPVGPYVPSDVQSIPWGSLGSLLNEVRPTRNQIPVPLNSRRLQGDPNTVVNPMGDPVLASKPTTFPERVALKRTG